MSRTRPSPDRAAQSLQLMRVAYRRRPSLAAAVVAREEVRMVEARAHTQSIAAPRSPRARAAARGMRCGTQEAAAGVAAAALAEGAMALFFETEEGRAAIDARAVEIRLQARATKAGSSSGSAAQKVRARAVVWARRALSPPAPDARKPLTPARGCCAQAMLRALFDMYDVDRSGALDAAELAVLFRELSVPAPPTVIDAATRTLSRRRDAALSAAEFTVWFVQHLGASEEPSPAAAFASAAHARVTARAAPIARAVGRFTGLFTRAPRRSSVAAAEAPAAAGAGGGAGASASATPAPATPSSGGGWRGLMGMMSGRGLRASAPIAPAPGGATGGPAAAGTTASAAAPAATAMRVPAAAVAPAPAAAPATPAGLGTAALSASRRLPVGAATAPAAPSGTPGPAVADPVPCGPSAAATPTAGGPVPGRSGRWRAAAKGAPAAAAAAAAAAGAAGDAGAPGADPEDVGALMRRGSYMALVRRVPLGAGGALVAAFGSARIAAGNALGRFTGRSTHHALARRVLVAEERTRAAAAGRAAFRRGRPPPLVCAVCAAPAALQRAFEAHVRTHGPSEQARIGNIRRRLWLP